MRSVKIATLILVFLCCTLSTFAQQLPTKPPSAWSINLNTGGAPWEIQFRVTIEQDGNIRIEKKDKRAPEFKQIHDGHLPEAQLKEIYSHTVSALAGFRFRDAPSDVADGTSLRLSLSAYGTSMQIGIAGLQDAGAAGEHVKAVLKLMNENIPKDAKVW